MTVATKVRPGSAQAPVKARELMEQLNTDATKLNIWVRTELNAPAQRPWFIDTGGATGAGQLAAGGRVAANQLKTLPSLWRWKDYRPFLDRHRRRDAIPRALRSGLYRYGRKGRVEERRDSRRGYRATPQAPRRALQD
jgi:hypothetical protein